MYACFKRLMNDSEGGVLIIFAFLTFFLVAVAGAGVDMGRSQIIKHKMQQSTDAAALAGAAAGYGLTEAQRDQVVSRYFRLNFPDQFMGSDITSADLDVSYVPDATRPDTVNVQLASEVQTNFVQTVGVEKIGINAETEVAVQGTGPSPADIVLTLDLSGSMRLKDSMISCSTTNYVDSMRGDPDDPATRMYSLRRSISSFINTLSADEPNPSENYSLATVLYGRDTVPSGHPELTARSRTLITRPYNDDLESMRSYYLGSGVAGNFGILDAERGPGTLGGLGAQTAHAMVDTTVRPYGTKDGRIQSVIFMTDGRNMEFLYTDPTGWYERDSPAQNSLFQNQCTQMKNKGVVVYTVAFGGDNLCFPNIAQLLRNCATSPDHAHVAVTGDELDNAFRQIASSISKLRIVK